MSVTIVCQHDMTDWPAIWPLATFKLVSFFWNNWYQQHSIVNCNKSKKSCINFIEKITCWFHEYCITVYCYFVVCYFWIYSFLVLIRRNLHCQHSLLRLILKKTFLPCCVAKIGYGRLKFGTKFLFGIALFYGFLLDGKTIIYIYFL